MNVKWASVGVKKKVTFTPIGLTELEEFGLTDFNFENGL